jgi:hypothetical protein
VLNRDKHYTESKRNRCILDRLTFAGAVALVALGKFFFWNFASFSLEENKEEQAQTSFAPLLGIKTYTVNLILIAFLSPI